MEHTEAGTSTLLHSQRCCCVYVFSFLSVWASAVSVETGFTVNYPLQKEQRKLQGSFPWDMEASGRPSSEQILFSSWDVFV